MSRDAIRSPTLRRRPSRTIPATIVAVILLALGVALVWTSISALVRGRWPSFFGGFHRWLGALSWGATIVLVISIAAVVVGLVLLIAALHPGRFNAVPMRSPAQYSGDQPSSNRHPGDSSEQTEFVMTRRSLARLATAHAATIDGVDSASAVATGNKVAMTVRTPSAERSEMARQVDDRVREALEAAGLASTPSVSTNVQTARP